jgi:hypothetical protein
LNGLNGVISINKELDSGLTDEIVIEGEFSPRRRRPVKARRTIRGQHGESLVASRTLYGPFDYQSAGLL